MRLAQAWGYIVKHNLGIKCPYGCDGCAVRVFGLVKHLMERHGLSEKKAWREARKCT